MKSPLEVPPRSSDDWQTLANSMPQIVWMAGPDGMLDYFNDVWYSYSGTRFEQNIGTGWIDAVHPEDLPRTKLNWENSLRTGTPYEVEFRLRSHEGDYRWFVARARPYRTELGIQKWYGTNTDIHDFKILTDNLRTAQRDLVSEKQKLSAIFASSSASLALLRGQDFIIEIANQSYLELFNNRDLVGKAFVEALPELIGQEFPMLAKHVYETGVTYTKIEDMAYLRRTDEGILEERYFDQSYLQIRDLDEKPYGVLIHAIEVTERVRARRETEETAERFRLAVSAANMGTWELNLKTGVVTWSDRCRELFGFPQQGEIPLNVIMENIHSDDRERVQKSIAQALDPQGNGHYSIDYRIIPEHGITRWVTLSGQSFFADTPEGRVTTRFVGTVLDVTDRIVAEVALREAKDRAELANAAKSTFLANMSHEIRTPLGAIMGFVSLIRDEAATPQMISEYVAVVERNSTQLLRIIDDILDLSKVEAGMMLIEHLEFSLIELLSDFSSMLGLRAREKGITFEMKAKTPLPSVIISDPTRLRQILSNVVGNAIKFTERGHVHLFVSFIDNQIVFEVEDTGRGITPEQASKLFLPFSQGDVSMTRKYGGTGLGLALTRRLSEALGGTFVLKQSQLAQGSIFVATIRAEGAQNVQKVKALGFAAEPVRKAGALPTLSHKKILVVEDSIDNQSLFSIYLGRAGAQIDIACDGSEGVEKALGEHYDMILMDVQMPVMDGITAVKKLRASGYQKPIVALTAHAMKEERTRCLDAGYTDFLSKPCIAMI